MKRLAVLIGLLMAGCVEPPPPGELPSPTQYYPTNGGLHGCKTWGFETICRRG